LYAGSIPVAVPHQKHKTMEKISELYFEYIDDTEGLTPEVWVEQYDLNEEEKEYFLFLLN
jgi:hypothetical protein